MLFLQVVAYFNIAVLLVFDTFLSIVTSCSEILVGENPVAGHFDSFVNLFFFYCFD